LACREAVPVDIILILMDDYEARRDALCLLPGVQRAPDQPPPGGADDQELADLERRLGVANSSISPHFVLVSCGELAGQVAFVDTARSAQTTRAGQTDLPALSYR
jgi:hypothetical protein